MTPNVTITADHDEPIALNFKGHPDKRYVTTTEIRFQFGAGEVIVPARFEFDGPTIPRSLWIFAGFSPADIDTALASCVHDWGCDHPELIPRAIANSLFFEALGPMLFNRQEFGGVGRARRDAMAEAVHLYSIGSGKEWR